MQTSEQTPKAVFFVHTKTFEGLKVTYLRFVLFCACEKFFVKKTNKLEITLIPSIYTTTPVIIFIFANSNTFSYDEQLTHVEKRFIFC